MTYLTFDDLVSSSPMPDRSMNYLGENNVVTIGDLVLFSVRLLPGGLRKHGRLPKSVQDDVGRCLRSLIRGVDDIKLTDDSISKIPLKLMQYLFPGEAVASRKYHVSGDDILGRSYESIVVTTTMWEAVRMFEEKMRDMTIVLTRITDVSEVPEDGLKAVSLGYAMRPRENVGRVASVFL